MFSKVWYPHHLLQCSQAYRFKAIEISGKILYTAVRLIVLRPSKFPKDPSCSVKFDILITFYNALKLIVLKPLRYPLHCCQAYCFTAIKISERSFMFSKVWWCSHHILQCSQAYRLTIIKISGKPFGFVLMPAPWPWIGSMCDHDWQPGYDNILLINNVILLSS